MSEDTNHSEFRTSYSLLDRVKDPNNEQAWNEFVRIYERYIYNILRHIRLDESEAKELCQDIIVKLWKKIPEFAYNKDRGKFRKWLSVIIRNDAYNHFNKNKTKSKYFEHQEDEQLNAHTDPEGTKPLDEIIDEEWKHHVSNLAWESIQSNFNESTLKIFKMYMDEKSNKEIAEACNVKERSIKTYIFRIRKHLKEEMLKLDEELL